MTLYPEDIERYGQPVDEPTEADPLRALVSELYAIAGRLVRFEWLATDIDLDDRTHTNVIALGQRIKAVIDSLPRRALVGGRSAAPTREQDDERPDDSVRRTSLGAQRLVAAIDAHVAKTHEPLAAGKDPAVAAQLFSEDSIELLLKAREVVALLSRSAEPPEAERILDEARSLMRTARSLDPTKPVSNELLGQVFGDLIDLLAPDGVAAEPNAEYEALRAAERGFIVAPWTDRQVEALNAWQRERPVHPFTCGKRDDHESEGVLTATREGWVCEEPDCDYAQDWAHDFMAMTAGVAAGPQATPDQVLWEGETTEAERISGWSYVADNEGQQRRDWGRCSLLVQVPGGTRVRVVAVPTDPTAVRVAEVRRPVPGARDMTGDAVPTDHEDQP